ncbi:peptidoglycan-binding protein [Actinomyces capricornis]|uniref:Peptidoglycan-binding protein n=2 Tax=Actinomyces capricornis TaxID=2755559 RepID=A0ABN6K6I0_9ACTO|nr:peptidoglycan-binding protein [Actinomyces capricornis]
MRALNDRAPAPSESTSAAKGATAQDRTETTDAARPDAPASEARPMRRRALLAGGACAALALTAGAVMRARRIGPFSAPSEPSSRPFSGATDTVTRGDLQGQASVSGTLRYSEARTLTSGFEGVLIGLPASGTVLTQGDLLYRAGAEAAYLMHGALPAWRTLEAGVDDGEDVRQLQAALRSLGYLEGEPDNRFGRATTGAVLRWQRDAGLSRTGSVPLGQVVFSPGDLRVGPVSARLGDRVGMGSELYAVTSTTQVVDAPVKLSDQGLAAVGTAVTITMPDSSTASGTISTVGTPTEKTSGSGESKERIIPVTITLDEAGSSTAFQEASVTVALPSQTREDVLSVPLGALLALSPQQYGVEVVQDDGTTRKVPVTTGLFAAGRVEISGEGITAGQSVVVPQ